MNREAQNAPDSFWTADISSCLVDVHLIMYILHPIRSLVTALINILTNVFNRLNRVAVFYVVMGVKSAGEDRIVCNYPAIIQLHDTIWLRNFDNKATISWGSSLVFGVAIVACLNIAISDPGYLLEHLSSDIHGEFLFILPQGSWIMWHFMMLWRRGSSSILGISALMMSSIWSGVILFSNPSKIWMCGRPRFCHSTERILQCIIFIRFMNFTDSLRFIISAV